jgi:RecG-like helicase
VHSQGLRLAAPASDPALLAHDRPPVPPGAAPIGPLVQADHSTVEGRIHSVEIRPDGQGCVLDCTIADATGQLTALFYGRQNIPGVEPGSMIRLHDTAGRDKGATVMINPSYELVPQMA